MENSQIEDAHKRDLQCTKEAIDLVTERKVGAKAKLMRLDSLQIDRGAKGQFKFARKTGDSLITTEKENKKEKRECSSLPAEDLL